MTRLGDKRTREIAQDDAKAWRKEAREQRKALGELAAGVVEFLRQLDVLMKLPSTMERGQKIAQLMNALEMLNDAKRYGALRIDFRGDKREPDTDLLAEALRARGWTCEPPGAVRRDRRSGGGAGTEVVRSDRPAPPLAHHPARRWKRG